MDFVMHDCFNTWLLAALPDLPPSPPLPAPAGKEGRGLGRGGRSGRAASNHVLKTHVLKNPCIKNPGVPAMVWERFKAALGRIESSLKVLKVFKRGSKALRPLKHLFLSPIKNPGVPAMY